MNTTGISSLGTALGVLRDAVREQGPRLAPALRREIGRLATGLLADLTAGLDRVDDPREVLQVLEMIEGQYRAVLRAQLQAVAAAEATGAHLLTGDEYDRLRSGDGGGGRAAQYVTGRAVHRNTAAVVAAWLGINEFEAAARVADAHRVIARRTTAGTAAGPRYAKLSRVFLDTAGDPRPARDAARRLEKLEPEPPDGALDADGVLPAPSAAGPDGVLLEDHVARVLAGPDPATAAKRVTELCGAYRAAQAETIAPQEYFRKVRTVLGVDVYQFAVAGVNAEVVRSLVAQWDNPATKAGQAARTAQATTPPTGPDPAPPRLPDSPDLPTPSVPGRRGTTPAAPAAPAPAPEPGTAEAVGSWLKTDDPPPDWAIDLDSEPDSEPGQADRAADEPANQAVDGTPQQVHTKDGPCRIVREPGPAAGPVGPPGDFVEPSAAPPPTSRQRKPATGSAGPACGMREPAPTAATRRASDPPTDAGNGNGCTASGAGQVSVERRRLNAFMNLLRQRTTATGHGTTVLPTLNVYLHLSQLQELAHTRGLCNAQGVTAHGVRLSAGQLRRALCEANVIPYVLGGQGQVLDMGRARRTFTRAQRQALLARDRGCICPDCTFPPERCEGHHWDEGGWAGGCPTNVDKGSMLCPNEHDDHHAGKFRIVLVNGLPHVLYPPHIDPSQTPRRNRYWYAHDEPVPGQPPPPLFRPGLPMLERGSDRRALEHERGGDPARPPPDEDG